MLYHLEDGRVWEVHERRFEPVRSDLLRKQLLSSDEQLFVVLYKQNGRDLSQSGKAECLRRREFESYDVARELDRFHAIVQWFGDRLERIRRRDEQDLGEVDAEVRKDNVKLCARSRKSRTARRTVNSRDSEVVILKAPILLLCSRWRESKLAHGETEGIGNAREHRKKAGRTGSRTSNMAALGSPW